jgi:hypothetical protein
MAALCRYRPSACLSDARGAPARLTLRHYSPTDPARIAARPDFEAEHKAMGEPLFGPKRPEGLCWTLTAGPGRWDRPLACGGLEPQGQGRFAAWLYAADMGPRGWIRVRRAFRGMVAEARARRVEVTVRVGNPRDWKMFERRAAYAEALGLKREGVLRGFGPDGSDYILYAGVF